MYRMNTLGVLAGIKCGDAWWCGNWDLIKNLVGQQQMHTLIYDLSQIVLKRRRRDIILLYFTC